MDVTDQKTIRKHRYPKSRVSTPKFKPDESDFEDAIYRYHGNITAIAKQFGVKRETVHHYFKRNPEANQMLKEARDFTTEIQLDDFEYVNRYAMSQYKTQLGYALRASEKIVDKKGHLRGYGKPEETGQIQNIRVRANNDLASGINFPAETLSDPSFESPEHGD